MRTESILLLIQISTESTKTDKFIFIPRGIPFLICVLPSHLPPSLQHCCNLNGAQISRLLYFVCCWAAAALPPHARMRKMCPNRCAYACGMYSCVCYTTAGYQHSVVCVEYVFVCVQCVRARVFTHSFV